MSRTRKESQSQKLRSVFYILWEQDDEGFNKFESYYDSKMKKLVTHYKKLIRKS